MSIIEDDDLYELRNAARPLGFWVGRHAFFDPARGGGPYYIMRRKEYPEQKNPTLLRFATKEMIEDYLQVAVGNYAN